VERVILLADVIAAEGSETEQAPRRIHTELTSQVSRSIVAKVIYMHSREPRFDPQSVLIFAGVFILLLVISWWVRHHASNDHQDSPKVILGTPKPKE
jgi:hypothetical protein